MVGDGRRHRGRGHGMTVRTIPDPVRWRQIEASDPAVSAFVSANAGAGKTHVLAQRVIRLLLAGVAPAKILCITFTKAAAANMAARVFDTLARWIALDDDALDREMRLIGETSIGPHERAGARRLFASALDAPGGLKVQTIHAFCTRLLHQFPFEANVAARFTVLDEHAETELRDEVTKWIGQAGGVTKAIAELSRTLGVDPTDDLARIDAELVDGPILPSLDWATVAAICDDGSAKKRPDLAERLAREQARVAGLRERRNAVVSRDRTAALLVIGEAVIARYRAEKEARGLLDYDDLIDKTLRLLKTVNPGWVHYKLDRGIDHVLIDEAQDTSEAQWDIITRLVSEFTSGAGARDAQIRTIFAVGDEKQSIFSFQGAVPRKFDEMRRHFERAHTAIGSRWRYVRFDHSFRSGPNVLGAVNEVFRGRDVYASVTSDDAGIAEHRSLPDAAPGLVEIWPLMRPPERRETEGWDAPFDALALTSPQVRLAQRIAETIDAGIRNREPLGRDRKPMTAGDVLVLVRQRGALFEAIIRALKERRIAVAGADRLVLTEHIAVVDMMALADALLLPDDDLALAIALKSPLLGLDEDQLFALAWDRTGPLRAALAAKAAQDPAIAAAADLIDRAAAIAQAETPFGFYAWLLGPAGGRGKFLARLGPEATDALDEFLELALDYERREAPSLQGFMAWLRAAETEIKRDMEITRDEVRVMTVHGAKGLEAPLVILADTTTPPAGPGQRQPRLLDLATDGLGIPGHFVWAGPKANDVA